ncbi:phorbol-12-myristate-13-acetate-induced protein 1 isoform X1 [Echinops telfairi]|uniref:Phorbol-12-myristate-13-acetate-induced protein 1 isoform X1 n=1 Tax=Echinops telfairi TaxID=9371 RepID=A0AC55DKA7_ECHTE|nr:phorbol-12-myristate-13-acetate-induced protein 1 isoform X1 [Echinops telfairi]
MPGKRARKSAQPSPARAPAGTQEPGRAGTQHEVECAMQLRRIGDRLNWRQKLLSVIAKLFRSGT